MRALALDIGAARVGIAVSDPSGRMASPLAVLPAREVFDNARSFRMLLEDWDPDVLVFGLPKTLSGEEGPQAKEVRAHAERIAQASGIEHCFVDERLSSTEAKRILHEEGLNEKKMKGKVDMIAASLFLQTWLDARQS